jgi:pyruvate/2-oxoglutarate dehydrogenase complex dihydrolipoamide acyltransferase (E2) component
VGSGVALALLALLRRDGARVPLAATVAALHLAAGTAAPPVPPTRLLPPAPNGTAKSELAAATVARRGTAAAAVAAAAPWTREVPLRFAPRTHPPSRSPEAKAAATLAASVLRAVTEHAQILQDDEVDALLGISSGGGGGGHDENDDDGGAVSGGDVPAGFASSAAAQALEAAGWAAARALGSPSCGHAWRGAVRRWGGGCGRARLLPPHFTCVLCPFLS